ncbi:MAG: CDP-alcohol phosphatidyltransferase family protein [Mycobacteriales bacterium]
MSALAAGTVVVALALATLTALSARRPAAAVPALDGYFDRWSTLHGDFDPRGAWMIRTWLGWAYAVARPLARVGVQPHVLTLWSVEIGLVIVVLAQAGGRWLLLGCWVVVLSGLLDNLDGAVAVLEDRTSRIGFVLDSVVDRVADGLYLVALWRLGAPAWLCVAAGSMVALLEYTRARAGNAGMGEIGVVTIGERPTRIIVTAVALFCAGLYVGHQPLIAGLGAAATLGLSVISCGQLALAVRRILSHS